MKIIKLIAGMSAVVSMSCYGEPVDKKPLLNVPDDYQVSVKGFFQWDYDYFDGLHNSDENGSEAKLRRARIIFKGKLPDDFSYVLMANYNNAKKEVEFLNAFVRYKGLSPFDITIGRFKDPFGLEALAKAPWLSSIERSVMFNRPNPVRAGLFVDSGIMLSNAVNNTTWALALVKDGIEDENGKDMYGLTGRVTHMLRSHNGQLFHFGLAHAYRNVEKGMTFKIEEPLGVATAEKIGLLDTTIDDFSQTGLEFAYQKQGFSFQNEYILSSVKGDAAGEDVDIDSYYSQLTYTLSGEARKYKKGVFGAVVPKQGKKAVELVARYENNDFDSKSMASYSASVATLGVNVYFNKHVKAALNYIDSEADGLSSVDSGKAITSRLQVVF